jgi:hypothetical protein
MFAGPGRTPRIGGHRFRGSWLASDGGVSVDIHAGYQIVFAGKPAPTGFFAGATVEGVKPGMKLTAFEGTCAGGRLSPAILLLPDGQETEDLVWI